MLPLLFVVSERHCHCRSKCFDVSTVLVHNKQAFRFIILFCSVTLKYSIKFIAILLLATSGVTKEYAWCGITVYAIWICCCRHCNTSPADIVYGPNFLSASCTYMVIYTDWFGIVWWIRARVTESAAGYSNSDRPAKYKHAPGGRPTDVLIHNWAWKLGLTSICTFSFHDDQQWCHSSAIPLHLSCVLCRTLLRSKVDATRNECKLCVSVLPPCLNSYRLWCWCSNFSTICGVI